MGPVQNQRMITLAQFAVVGLVAVWFASTFSDDLKLASIDVTPEQEITTQIEGGLQVREAIGEPTPLADPLQGAKGSAQQEAAGSLQNPQKSSDLQPNAKLPDFPIEL